LKTSELSCHKQILNMGRLEVTSCTRPHYRVPRDSSNRKRNYGVRKGTSLRPKVRETAKYPGKPRLAGAKDQGRDSRWRFQSGPAGGTVSSKCGNEWTGNQPGSTPMQDSGVSCGLTKNAMSRPGGGGGRRSQYFKVKERTQRGASVKSSPEVTKQGNPGIGTASTKCSGSGIATSCRKASKKYLLNIKGKRNKKVRHGDSGLLGWGRGGVAGGKQKVRKSTSAGRQC